MPTDQQKKTQTGSGAPASTSAPPADTLNDPLASWVLPNAPQGYGGPGVINPDSNINPLNPMAAEMQAKSGTAPAPSGAPTSTMQVGVFSTTPDKDVPQ